MWNTELQDRVDYQVDNRCRKISMRMGMEGKVVVKMPSKRHMMLAEKFVSQNKDWIQRTIEKYRKRADALKKYKFNFEIGDRLILFDEPVYEIKWKKSAVKKYVLHEDEESITIYTEEGDSASLNHVLIKFYRDKAAEVFKERSEFFAEKLGVSFNKLFIKDQRTRWGSCSSNKNLNYNFRLLLAPERVLDYLVIHEICHLKEMNHSSSFWSLVEGLMPDYKNQVRWLKDNGFLLQYFLR